MFQKQPPEVFHRKVILKTPQNLQKNIFLNKIEPRRSATYDYNTVVFQRILRKCKEHLLYKTPLGGCFLMFVFQ